MEFLLYISLVLIIMNWKKCVEKWKASGFWGRFFAVNFLFPWTPTLAYAYTNYGETIKAAYNFVTM